MPAIRLALLLCDEIIFNSPTMRAAHHGYAKIFHDFLSSSLEQITSGGYILQRDRGGR